MPADGDIRPGGPDDRLLAWRRVREITGLSRTTAWRMQNAGDFPLPVRISPGRVGWWQSELDAWKASRAPGFDRPMPSSAGRRRRPPARPPEPLPESESRPPSPAPEPPPPATDPPSRASTSCPAPTPPEPHQSPAVPAPDDRTARRPGPPAGKQLSFGF